MPSVATAFRYKKAYRTDAKAKGIDFKSSKDNLARAFQDMRGVLAAFDSLRPYANFTDYMHHNKLARDRLHQCAAWVKGVCFEYHYREFLDLYKPLALGFSQRFPWPEWAQSTAAADADPSNW